MDRLAVALRPPAARGGKHLITQRIIDHTRDHLTIVARRQPGPSLLATQHHAERRKTVSEVGGTVQRIDVPAKLAFQAGTRAFFAKHSVIRKGRVQPLDDELFTGPIGLGDQVHIALVLRTHTALIEAAQQRPGFARNGLRGFDELVHKHLLSWHHGLSTGRSVFTTCRSPGRHAAALRDRPYL